jgi:predicted  nucleic acid-binding Zn-ribbon protein
MTMDIEGILDRYGIDIRDCPDRAHLVAMYRTVERLEEHCFAMQNELRGIQQEIRKLNHELFGLQEQSSHAKNLVSTPDAAPTGGCAPREDFVPGAI